MPAINRVERVVETLYREEYGRVLAPLIRLLGGFDRAEEVVQEAFEAALVQWPQSGLPDQPRAWIIRAARNKAIDRIRRRANFEDKRSQLRQEVNTLPPSPLPDEAFEEGGDDMLRLVFTCCHPSLSMDAQVALTLKTICGLDTEEVARAFLVSPTTVSQRIVRAKRKIRDANIPYRVPSEEDLPDRIEAALATVYLVFNEGYAATGGAALVRRELCREAIRLGELLCRLLPERPEPAGLLALMLLHDSRAEARVDAHGDLVPLEEQDRTRWDRDKIDRGLVLVESALRASRPNAYALQAAIAALHAQASHPQATDWAQIAALYHILSRLRPSPVVELNRAVAIAMAGDFAGSFQLIDALEGAGSLQGYHLLPATRAELYRRSGRIEDARSEYKAALALARNDVERRFLERRLRELGSSH